MRYRGDCARWRAGEAGCSRMWGVEAPNGEGGGGDVVRTSRVLDGGGLVLGRVGGHHAAATGRASGWAEVAVQEEQRRGSLENREDWKGW